MTALIDIDQIAEQSDETWTSTQRNRAELLLAGVLGWVARNAPCVADPDAAGVDLTKLAEARMIVSEAVLRAVESTGNIGSEGIGPSQVNYIDRAALPTLTNADEAALRALCPRRRQRRLGTIRTQPGY